MSNTQPECDGCQHQDRCEDVYRRLGASDAPPVMGKILLAFVVPMLLFVLVLAGSEWMLSDILRSDLTPVIGAVLAALAVLLYAALMRRLRR